MSKDTHSSQQIVRQVKDAVNIVEVISEHVVLKKSGSQLMGLCPFHGERTPSFSVSDSKQLYYCYGCQAGGDVIRFVMDIHGLPFPEALQDLAERAGIAVQLQKGSGAGASAQQNQTAFRLNRFIATYFRSKLQDSATAKNYLKDRGLTAEVQEQFYLGYAQNEWESLYQHLKKAKAPLAMAETHGSHDTA